MITITWEALKLQGSKLKVAKLDTFVTGN